MLSFLVALAAGLASAASPAPATVPNPAPARAGVAAESPIFLSDRRVRDAIKGAWLGGVVGGAWGAPTEFRYNGRIIPAAEVPRWSVEQANRYTFADPGGPDETYVELPFLDALHRHGPTAGWPAFGEAFANSDFKLFAANHRARANLRRGLRPPASGDPAHNPYAYNIDFQIESDFAGLLAPLQRGAAIDIAWRAGHVVGYGDGVYGGVMVSAMHAAAFRADSVDRIVQAGRHAVPAGTSYRRMIEDVLRWHARYPGDWGVTWRLLERKWNARDPAAKRDPRHLDDDWNNDAKLNGAYILLGLLYGDGDFERTVLISMRAGQDSDCNPNNAASILGGWLGYDRIPRRFTRGIARSREIANTGYTLRRAIATTYEVAVRLTRFRGGTAGHAGWRIPDDPPLKPIFEQWPLAADPPPSLTASFQRAGRTVSFHAEAADPDGVRAVRWSFGDLSAGQGTDPSHTYSRPGTYRAIVWAADGLGRTSAKTLVLTVP